MKNTIKILALLLMLLTFLASCQGANSAMQKRLATVDTLMKEQDDVYTLTVAIDSPDGHSTIQKYTVREENGERLVDYRIEEINRFVINSDSISVPDDYTTVKEGTLSARDAQITNFFLPVFDFSSKSLTNVAYENEILTADVSSIDSFISADLDAENASIEVSYTEEKVNYIVIYYVSASGNQVTVKYTLN